MAMDSNSVSTLEYEIRISVAQDSFLVLLVVVFPASPSTRCCGKARPGSADSFRVGSASLTIVESHIVLATKRTQHKIDVSETTIVGHCLQSL